MVKGGTAPLLWAFSGALLGVALISLLAIGWTLLLASILLGACAAWLTRGRGLWAGLIAFGLLPALILFFAILSAPPPCPTQPVIVSNGSFTCGGGVPPSYSALAFSFLAVAVLGALIPLAARLRHSLRPDRDLPPADAT